MNMKYALLLILYGFFCSCSNRTVIKEDFFNYPYKKVYDYYVINAWRELGETLPAYTPEMVESHSLLLGKLPWVDPVPSADKEMVIGMTPGWPKNPAWPDDPEIPPQKIFGYRITDPGAKGHKLKIILTSGNHATEFTGNWVLEGMVNFIAGDAPEAKLLRQKAIFYVYPDVNPEGRYQAVHRINLQAAPDPNAGTDMRKRGNPELYAAGEGDHNRIWNTRGKFSTIDIITASMIKDTGGEADYLWDMHGPQTTGNWRTPGDEARTNAYAEALLKREPDIVRCGPESGFKVNVAKGPEGKIGLYVLSGEGQRVKYPYVYEPGGWSRERLMESGRNIALAFYDILVNE